MGCKFSTLRSKQTKYNKEHIRSGPTIVKLTTIWKEIDRRLPNHMTCPEDKMIYNRLNQQNQLYQFLAGLDESLDKDRRDLLNTDQLPTVEAAYATIRRELSRWGIMRFEKRSLNLEPSGIRGDFAAKGRTEKPFQREDDKPNLRCTHCGGARHIKERCFKPPLVARGEEEKQISQSTTIEGRPKKAKDSSIC